MIIYLLTLGIVFVLAYYAQTKQKVLEDGVIKKTSTYGKWAIAAICAVLIFLAGSRYATGTDYWDYEGWFTAFMDAPFFYQLTNILQHFASARQALARRIARQCGRTPWRPLRNDPRRSRRHIPPSAPHRQP